MFRKLALFAASLTLAVAADAGVLFQIEAEDHTVSPSKKQTILISAEGEKLRMDLSDPSRTDTDTMVLFRPAGPDLVMVDHKRRSYFVIDERMVKTVTDTLAPMIEQALANVPEEQRAEVEKMMRERMGGALPNEAPAAPKVDLRKTSHTEKVQGFPATRYDVFEGGKKVREIWVTSWKEIDGGSDATGGFAGMGDFGRKILSSIQQSLGGGGDLVSQFGVFTRIQELGGFPVQTRELAPDGTIENESRLVRTERRDLAPGAFDIPDGYSAQAMFGAQ